MVDNNYKRRQVFNFNSLSCVAIIMVLIAAVFVASAFDIEWIWMAVIASLLIAVSLLGQAVIKSEIKRMEDNDTKKEEIRALEYKSLYEKQLQNTHDTVNHLLVIRSFIESGKSDAALNYLTNMLERTAVSGIISCNNSAVDALLNRKYTVAKEKGIDTYYEINDISECYVSDIDLITIISNSLDNALEAVEKSESKTIGVKIVYKDNVLLISVKNSFKNETEKSYKQGRGNGLKIIDRVIKQYDGIYTVQSSNDYFEFICIL